VAETTINLTVIGDRACSTTRTYLAYLREARLRPQRLWLVDFRRATGKERLARRLLGAGLTQGLLRMFRGTSESPREEAFASLCLRLQVEAGFPPIDHFAPLDADGQAVEVERFSAENFDDPQLHSRIARARDTAFLFTNGGIVPAKILERPDVRMLHVHPGIVPDMRGSDCLLWSALVRGRVGVSCFYMSPGIDEGDVIGQREFDLPRLASLAELLTPRDEDTAYRALLFAVDPHLRAQLLVDILRAHPDADLRRLPARKQPAALRPAYLWMHPRLRLHVMRKAFA
jgi:hypothetical protein